MEHIPLQPNSNSTTMQTTTYKHEGSGATALPQLPYSLHTRKISIAITWTIIWFFSSALIQILWFSLRYGSSLKPTIALAITVAILGVFTAQSLAIRIWHLMKKNAPRRPAGTKPWMLDFFMWAYLVSFVVVTVVIASATMDPPKVRQASMPQTTVLYITSCLILFSRVSDALGLKTPFRMSSVPRGGAVPPATLIITEDIVAVDGGGGQEYREALMARYQASEPFRRMLRQLDWFWGVGGLLIAIAVTLIVFLNPSEIVSFAVGEFSTCFQLIACTNRSSRLVSSLGLGCDMGHHNRVLGQAGTCSGTPGLCKPYSMKFRNTVDDELTGSRGHSDGVVGFCWTILIVKHTSSSE